MIWWKYNITIINVSKKQYRNTNTKLLIKKSYLFRCDYPTIGISICGDNRMTLEDFWRRAYGDLIYWFSLSILLTLVSWLAIKPIILFPSFLIYSPLFERIPQCQSIYSLANEFSDFQFLWIFLRQPPLLYFFAYNRN